MDHVDVHFAAAVPAVGLSYGFQQNGEVLELVLRFQDCVTARP